MILGQTWMLTSEIRVELASRREPTVRVTYGARELWSGIPTKWTPWKLTGGDIDGNGHPDFAVGIIKQTHIYPHPHKTIFFYEYRRGEIWPKWRGSSLGLPIEDFAYAEASNGPRLIAIQTTLHKKFRLCIWRWRQFGFRLERSEGDWLHAKFGKIEPKLVEIVTPSGSVWVKL